MRLPPQTTSLAWDNCGHQMCSECCLQFVRSALGNVAEEVKPEGLRCPMFAVGCGSFLTPEAIGQHLLYRPCAELARTAHLPGRGATPGALCTRSPHPSRLQIRLRERAVCKNAVLGPGVFVGVWRDEHPVPLLQHGAVRALPHPLARSHELCRGGETWTGRASHRPVGIGQRADHSDVEALSQLRLQDISDGAPLGTCFCGLLAVLGEHLAEVQRCAVLGVDDQTVGSRSSTRWTDRGLRESGRRMGLTEKAIRPGTGIGTKDEERERKEASNEELAGGR